MTSTQAVPGELSARAQSAAGAARNTQAALTGFTTEVALRKADADAGRAIQDLCAIQLGVRRLIAGMEAAPCL